jgi:hypothetical protein
MRILQFIPRGTESVPAMLEPGYDHGSGHDECHEVTIDFARDAFAGVVVDSSERVEQLANAIVRELRAQRRQWVEDDDGDSA